MSRDEEHVELAVAGGGRCEALVPRTFHYMFLTLARRRLGDVAAGLPDAEQGWRLLFDISSSTPGDIARVSWVTQDRYSGFSGGFTAPSASMSWPSPCYHYPTQHP